MNECWEKGDLISQLGGFKTEYAVIAKTGDCTGKAGKVISGHICHINVTHPSEMTQNGSKDNRDDETSTVFLHSLITVSF